MQLVEIYTFLYRCTGFAFRFEHRLPKLVQTIAPSIPFPVFKSEGEPGMYFCIQLGFLVNMILLSSCNGFNPSPVCGHGEQDSDV